MHPPPRTGFLRSRVWQGRALALLILCAGGLGLLGVYTLCTSPALSFETGRVFSLAEPALQRIDEVSLEPSFVQRLPEFFTRSAETAWWQQHARLYGLLTSQRMVQVIVRGPQGVLTTEQARVGPMPWADVLHRTWLIYLVALLYLLSALSVFQRHRSLPGTLLVFFFVACALYFTSSAPIVSRSVTLQPGYFQFLVTCLYAAAGGLIALVHFAFVFPAPKAILHRWPWLPGILYGYFGGTVILYGTGLIAFGATFPFFCFWIFVMIGAFLHALVREGDPFLKQQIRLSLTAPILADCFFVFLYILPGVLRIPPLDFTYFALFSLILPFALPLAMDNVSLYHARLQSEREAQQEQARLQDNLHADLHDVVLNILTLFMDSTEIALHQLAQDHTGVQQRLQTMHTLARDTARYVRGFLGVMAESVTTWQEFGSYLRYWGYQLVDPLQFTLNMAPAVVHLPPPALPLKICLFRCYTEALSNIVKHAQAQGVQVTLAQENTSIRCTIQDDGTGFTADAAAAGHYGLTHMPRRVEALGGTFTLTTQPGTGTCLTIQLPLQ